MIIIIICDLLKIIIPLRIQRVLHNEETYVIIGDKRNYRKYSLRNVSSSMCDL